MVATTPLMSYEEIIVDYVNQLRCELNEAQEEIKRWANQGMPQVQATENDAWRSDVAALNAECSKLLRENTRLRDERDELVIQCEEFVGNLRKVKPHRPMTREEGEKAIHEGREARQRHIQETREPQRGED